MGLSQVAIRTEYYVVDLPDIVSKFAKKEAVDMLKSLRLTIASNKKSLEEEDYQEYVHTLMKIGGIKNQSAEKFDRDGIERLRQLGG